ncbi:hypothetical protein CR513_34209, partial [Mucuna pruriens]
MEDVHRLHISEQGLPKRSLPTTYRLVDGASRYNLLSFMDAYSKYNQIWMHPSNKAKMTFIIDDGNFCYKNESATY